MTGDAASFNGTFDAGDDTFSVPIDAGDNVTCTLHSSKVPSLSINMATVVGNGTFDYYAPGLHVALPICADFQITTANGTGSYSGNPINFTSGQFDTKTATETRSEDRRVGNNACTGDTTGVTYGVAGDADSFNGPFDAGDDTITVPIDAGDNVTCTFTNTKGASLSINKATAGGNGRFDYEAAGSGMPDAAGADFQITTANGTGSYSGNPINFTSGQFDTKTATET